MKDSGLQEMDNISSEDDAANIENENSEAEEQSSSESLDPPTYLPSTVPESSADIHLQHGESDHDSQSSDDEVDSVDSEDAYTDRISNVLWPHREVDEAQVHSPLSTEPWSVEYTSRIRNLIEAALTKTQVPYFFTLTVLRIRSLEAPVIVVLTDATENINSIRKNLETIIQNSQYVFIFGKGTIIPSANNTSKTKYPRYHKKIQVGDAIEARKDEAGTAGLFIRKPNSERIYGLTAGHVIENLSLGSRVIQPARKHLAMDIDDVEYRIQRLQDQIKSLTDQSLRSKYEDELRKFQNDLAVLYGLKGANDRETRKNLKVGKIALRDRTVGILGLERIGMAIARRLDAMRVPVVYHTRRPRPDVGHRHFADLRAMAEAVDVLVIVIPGTPEYPEPRRRRHPCRPRAERDPDQYGPRQRRRRDGADRSAADADDPRRRA